MPRKVENIIGQRFGRLVVLENLHTHAHGSTLHRCICDCGNIVETPISYLKSGHTRSCGCLCRDVHTVHKLSKTRIYNIYAGMIDRCYRPNEPFYYRYGARGITVCEEWRNDFKTFYAWAMQNGYNDTLTIDRIDNDGNYEPSNCRWVTRAEQSRNTSRNKFFTLNGETKTISEWSRILGIPQTTLFRRIKQNRPLNEILYKGNLYKIIRRKDYERN